jgi:D-alanine-D-alanine ligase
MKKNIAIFIGGKSPEHEVSVITGLQMLENLNKSEYNPILIFVSKDGDFFEVVDIKSRKEFFKNTRREVFFGFDSKEKKPIILTNDGGRRVLYCALSSLHGGEGESGMMAGFFRTINIPFSSTDVESAVICMNKNLSKKEVLEEGVPVIESKSFKSFLIKENIDLCKQDCLQIGLPLIIKPVHLGSSIGIKIVKSEIDLELALLESAQLDNEILVEKFVSPMVEYNCSVKMIGGKIITSEIEQPLNKDEILSFEDKYKRGGKKTGGSGMASLPRKLPVEISVELKNTIKEYSKKVYIACRCKGTVRIDFIFWQDKLFFNEINPIPGSLAYYLWEVEGISFKDQLTEMIEQSVYDFKQSDSLNYVYQTDIIKKFIDA